MGGVVRSPPVQLYPTRRVAQTSHLLGNPLRSSRTRLEPYFVVSLVEYGRRWIVRFNSRNAGATG